MLDKRRSRDKRCVMNAMRANEILFVSLLSLAFLFITGTLINVFLVQKYCSQNRVTSNS